MPSSLADDVTRVEKLDDENVKPGPIPNAEEEMRKKKEKMEKKKKRQ